MVGTMHGTHEEIVQEARMRNKRITMVDYADISNIELLATEVNNSTATIEEIKIFCNGTFEIPIRILCCVVIPTTLYMIFEGDYFNKLIPGNRKTTFKNLVDFVNRGH